VTVAALGRNNGGAVSPPTTSEASSSSSSYSSYSSYASSYLDDDASGTSRYYLSLI
jgi:hypothetical protein